MRLAYSDGFHRLFMMRKADFVLHTRHPFVREIRNAQGAIRRITSEKCQHSGESLRFAWKCNQGHFPDLVCGIVHKCLNSFLKGQMENISGFAGNIVSIV